MIAILALVVSGFPIGVRAADSEEPIITFHTNAKEQDALGFGITLGTMTKTEYYEIDFGFGKEEVEVSPWTVEEGVIKGTYIACTPTDVVKIYGDASQLSLMYARGAFITTADFQKCTNLEVIDLSHNELRSLDLTPFTKLYAIY
ncbi:MAG: hypothetical protein K2F71_01920, partial [Paramuribaculum sp.]|nr:hypothetical protein [Paramuribaculum sp.]